jgi:hypothetical protein
MKKNTENKSLRAVVYVKESGSASSFPMAVELLPIASEPDDKITYLEWTHIPGEEDNAFRNTDRFKCCFQVMSIFALVFNFLMTTTAFIFFMLILSSSLRQDKCDTVFGWLMTLIALGLFAWNIWMKLSTLISYDSSVNVWYKIIDGISILCPPLKYHVYRLRGRYLGENFKNVLKRDAICNVLMVLGGISSAVAASQCKRPKDDFSTPYGFGPEYRSDAFLIVFAVFLLVQSVIMWPIAVFIHARWIAEQCNKQKLSEDGESSVSSERID